MIPKLALLSGKGGSGKTTIALSLAKMLNDCGIKVLLIDCDTATNGATYFFETKLGKKHQYLSVLEMFLEPIEHPVERMLKVDDNFWFVPSSISFPNEIDAFKYIENVTFTKNFKYCQEEFDVLIFDCQAGYSTILNTILELSTTNLVVLEPDAISASSVRVLYAQISSLVEKTKTFQIFNKITDEEYSLYQQVNVGLFTSLPPIKFTWEVRKAFAFAKIPEMASTNVKFGKDVFELANILFPAFEKPLFTYTRNILTQEKEELELEIKKLETLKYDVIQNEKAFSMKDLVSEVFRPPIVMAAITFFCVIIMFSLTRFEFFYMSTTTFFIALTGMVFYMLLLQLVLIKKKNIEKKFLEGKKALAEYEYEHSKLLKRIAEIDKTVEQGENVK